MAHQHEGLELEDPAQEPNYDDLLVLGVTPEKAPDEGEYVTMTFEKGIPTSLNGKSMKVSEIITELNNSASVLGYAKEGTIYPILYRLEDEGCLTIFGVIPIQKMCQKSFIRSQKKENRH